MLESSSYEQFLFNFRKKKNYGGNIIRLDEHTRRIFTWNRKTNKKKKLNYCKDKVRKKRSQSSFFTFSFTASITLKDQNRNSGSTSIAHANFARRDLLNICKIDGLDSQPIQTITTAHKI